MSKSNITRSIIIALVIGTILNATNYGPEYLKNPNNYELLFRVVITYIIPFVVSLYSSYYTRKTIKSSSRSALEFERLSSFPDQNPNPIIELSTSGDITYCNPTTDKYFPDISKLKIDHPIFEPIKSKIKNGDYEGLNNFSEELTYQDYTFELKLFFQRENNIIRAYYSDITILKQTEEKLSALALFPEQNPNPVIEACYDTNTIHYLNSAAKKCFPTIEKEKLNHPLFDEIKTSIDKINDTFFMVDFEKRTYELRVYSDLSTTLLRVFCNDITERIESEKNLSRLASFPEGNPSPIIEFDLEGNMTYTNPAAKSIFTDIDTLGSEHSMLKPFLEHFEGLKTRNINFYREEITIDGQCFSQRGQLIEEGKVIRLFNINITEQKRKEEIIAEKNKNITDSINYAKRIQSAILPPIDFMQEHLVNSFILYKPKDIVAGDFYWFDVKENTILFAVCDCTGHGVPGAMVSVICHNAMNRAVKEFNLIDPASILDKTREIVMQEFSKSNDDVKDGMDIALCTVDGEELLYSGAYNPLWIVRNNEILEFKADKQPIGSFDNPKSFTTHKVNIKQGDVIYLFTDGYVDQFGGEVDKKYGSRRLKDFLLTIQDIPFDEQKEKLDNEIQRWMQLSDSDQLDDICIMGVKI